MKLIIDIPEEMYAQINEDGIDTMLIPYKDIIKNGTPIPDNATTADDVLDKIRAEINGMCIVILKGTPKDDWAVRWNDCLDEVLQIIDKYRNEVRK